MDSLIAELEQAQEGSRELDRKIAVALGWKVDQQNIQGDDLWLAPGDSWTKRLPAWTTNLQDALGLVPEEWNWSVQSGSYAVVRSPDAEYDYSGNPWDGLHLVAGRDEDATAATPALALTIAALKARQEET